MAQLTDDCFAFGGALMPVEDAVRIIAANIAPVAAIETVDVAMADDRVLAGNIAAPIDLPPYTNSAVDGYAVRLDDLAETETLPIAGRSAAGDISTASLKPGAAWRIFTGARLPEGADTVFMQEDVQLDESGRVHFPSGLRHGANTRARGEDLRAGAIALPSGRILRPQDLAIAAGLGLRKLPVRKPVRLALFSTGDEVAEPGTKLTPGRLYDANRALLASMARRAGAEVTDLGILADDPDTIASALRDAVRTHDLILTSGGVSTGEADYMRRTIETLGTLVFWRLAIKPGRPVAMGMIDGTPLIGLPGNPVAAFVTFVHVARPLIAALAGTTLPPRMALPVRAGFTWRKKAGRREYLRVRLTRTEDGEPVAHKHPQDGAGILTSLTETDGLAELAEPVTTVGPGDYVGYLPYDVLF
ncbi:MAG TPA: gephyrin-like molybdotransferase Glp [Acidiphilium sp.]